MLIRQLLKLALLLQLICNGLASIENVLDLKTRINRLIINSNDRTSGDNDLYVASTNHLYKISDRSASSVAAEQQQQQHQQTTLAAQSGSTFKIDVDLVTGPKLQKQQCAVINPSFSSFNQQCIKYVCDDDFDSKSATVKQIDNNNRLLLIDQKNKNLIECGSIDYGGCRLRELDSLEIIGCNYSAPVIPFESASGVIVSSSSKNLFYK